METPDDEEVRLLQPTHALFEVAVAYIRRHTIASEDASRDQLVVQLPGRLTYVAALRVDDRDGRPFMRFDAVGQEEDFLLEGIQPVGLSYRADQTVEAHFPGSCGKRRETGQPGERGEREKGQPIRGVPARSIRRVLAAEKVSRNWIGRGSRDLRTTKMLP